MALTDGLVRYYKCDENAANTSVVDSTGNGDGVSSTNTSNLSISGKISNGFNFVAANSEKVTVADHTDLDFGTGDFCFNMWYKDTGTGTHLFSTQENSPYAGTNLWIGTGGVYVRMSAGGGTQVTPNDYTTSTWKMVTFQRDGTDVQIWIDGTFINSITSSANITSTADLTFYWIVWAGYYSGSIDEFGVWNRRLTQAEIESLYNSGSGLSYPFSTENIPGNIFMKQSLIL